MPLSIRSKFLIIDAMFEAVIDAKAVKAVANAAKPVPMANTASPIAPMAAANASNPIAPADIAILATAIIANTPARPPNAIASCPIDKCPSIAIGGTRRLRAAATRVIAAAPANDPFARAIAATTSPNATPTVTSPLAMLSQDIAPNAAIGITIKFIATATALMPIAALATFTPSMRRAKATTSARIPAIAPSPLTMLSGLIRDRITMDPDMAARATDTATTPRDAPGSIFCLLTARTNNASSPNTAAIAIRDLPKSYDLIVDITLSAADKVSTARASAPMCSEEVSISTSTLDIAQIAPTSTPIVVANANNDLAISLLSIVDITLRAAAMIRTALAKAVIVNAPFIAAPLLKLNLEM